MLDIDFQRRLSGFLCERLSTIFFIHYFKNPFYSKVIKINQKNIYDPIETIKIKYNELEEENFI